MAFPTLLRQLRPPDDAFPIETWLAEDPARGKVIVKRVAAAASEAQRQHWNRQLLDCGARALRARGPRIAEAFEADMAEGTAYVVSEFVAPGESVKTLLHGSLIPVERALRIAHRTALALVSGAESAVAHGCITPAKIMIGPPEAPGFDAVKLRGMGMGAIRLMGDRAALDMETAHCMAPELYRIDAKPDFRSDVYSLGATLYQMVTGTVLFPGDDLDALFFKKNDETPRKIIELRPNLLASSADVLDSVVRRMVDKDPVQRYQAPESLVERIEALASSLGVELEPPPPPPEPEPVKPIVVPPPPPPKFNWRPVAIGAGIVAVLVILAVLLWPMADHSFAGLVEARKIKPVKSISEDWPPFAQGSLVYTVSADDTSLHLKHLVIPDNCVLKFPNGSKYEWVVEQFTFGNLARIELSAPQARLAKAANGKDGDTEARPGLLLHIAGAGANGAKGANGGNLDLYVGALDARGTLHINTTGGPGQEGGNGGAGSSGSGLLSGGSGGRGGNGGDGGDTAAVNVMLFQNGTFTRVGVITDAAAYMASHPISKLGDIVIIGLPGQGGAGGAGGPGGRGALPARNGANGEAGKPGAEGHVTGG